MQLGYKMSQAQMNAYITPVFAITAVTVVDTERGISSNTAGEYIGLIDNIGQQAPFAVTPITFRAGTAADALNYDASISVNDLVAVVQVDLSPTNSSMYGPYLYLCNMLITQKFTNNAVSPQYNVQIFSFGQQSVSGSVLTPWNRALTVTPTSGANSAAVYSIIPATRSGVLTYDNAALVQSYDDASTKQITYLRPQPMMLQYDPESQARGFTDVVVIVLKNQVGFAQQTTVLPLFGHSDSALQMDDMFSSLIVTGN